MRSVRAAGCSPCSGSHCPYGTFGKTDGDGRFGDAVADHDGAYEVGELWNPPNASASSTERSGRRWKMRTHCRKVTQPPRTGDPGAGFSSNGKRLLLWPPEPCRS